MSFRGWPEFKPQLNSSWKNVYKTTQQVFCELLLASHREQNFVRLCFRCLNKIILLSLLLAIYFKQIVAPSLKLQNRTSSIKLKELSVLGISSSLAAILTSMSGQRRETRADIGNNNWRKLSNSSVVVIRTLEFYGSSGPVNTIF